MKQKCDICSNLNLIQIFLYDLQLYKCKQCDYIVLAPGTFKTLMKLILLNYTIQLDIPVNKVLTYEQQQRFLYFNNFFNLTTNLKHRKELPLCSNQCGVCFKKYKKYKYYGILQYYYCKHNPIYLIKGEENAPPSIWIEQNNFEEFVQFVIKKTKKKKFYFKCFCNFIFTKIKSLFGKSDI